MSQTSLDPIVTEMKIFAFGFAPTGWFRCDGQYLTINGNQALFSLLGLTYGGDAVNFRLPDMKGRVLLNAGDGYTVGKAGGETGHVLTLKEMAAHGHIAIASSNARNANTPKDNFWAFDKTYNKTSNTKLYVDAMGKTGGDQPHDNMAPFLSLNYCIAHKGVFPGMDFMDEDYIGTIKAYATTRVPSGSQWVPCDGRRLSISQYVKLYSIIKNKYGGDDKTYFNVPDLRGRASLHFGQGEGLTHYDLGETGGVKEVTLTEAQLPAHKHKPNAQTSGSTPNANENAIWSAGIGRPPGNAFANAKGTGLSMNPGAIAPEGGNAPHNNMMPYQVMNYYIAFDGVFPDRN